MKLKNLLLTSLLLTTVSTAQAAIIDFSGLDNGTIIDNEYMASHGVTFSGTNVARGTDNIAVTFDTSLANTADPDLESPFSNSNLGLSNPGNVLIIHENISSCDDFVCNNPDDEGRRPAGFFTINFAQAVTLNSIDFFDIENIENGQTLTNAINLYDVNDIEINPNTFYTPDTGGNNTWDRLTFNALNVSSIKINLTGSGAIDNLDFTPNVTTTIPEPNTLFLMAMSLLALLRFKTKQ